MNNKFLFHLLFMPTLAPNYAENADLLGALAPDDADLTVEGLTTSLMKLPAADIRRTGFKEEDQNQQ
ncbi:MAG: hypothetical protein R2753_10655 [Chitinophagales bacterium]